MKKVLGALLAMVGAASAAPRVGYGPTYDRDLGDVVVATPQVMNLSGIQLVDGVITISGGSGVDAVTVTLPTRATIKVTRNSYTETYSLANLTKVVFDGNAGDDTFTNSTHVPSEVNGGDGNDSLSGGSGKDFIIGGYGNDQIDGNGNDDVLWGSGGHDSIYGGDGDDLLKGHGGEDHLYGEAGEDALYGGSSDDYLSGGSDADTLVSIGGGLDELHGGTGNDFFWADSTETVEDLSLVEAFGRFANKVSSFYAYSYDGGTTTTPVAKDLTNYSLLDPVADNANVHLENFADRPLFRDGGPHKEDVLQGAAGDCFVLGPLSAVADQTPDSIRKLVVDLDDGTYVVRQFRTEGGAAEFVRVDADLWVNNSNNALTYAKLGLGQEALWGPIVEKAFAFFRRQNGSYAAIDGGNGSGSGSVIMGADNETSHETAEPYTAAQIIAWDTAGRPAGAIRNHINATVPVLLNWIQDHLEAGKPVYTGNISGASNTMTLTEDRYRRGQHIIMVDHVDFDANGNPISLTLRDQVGNNYRTISDFTRIYFFIGRARLYEMP